MFFYNEFIDRIQDMYKFYKKAVKLLLLFATFCFFVFMENKFVLDPYFGETTDPDSLINYIYTPLFLKTKIDVLYFDILNWEKYDLLGY